MGIKIGGTDITKIKIASGQTPRLPVEYQEVEYIQSSGTQYINTGYTYNSSNKVKYELDYELTSSSGASYFGARTATGTGDGWSGIPYSGKIYSKTTNFGSFATTANTKYVLSLEFIPSSNTANLIQYTNGTKTTDTTYTNSSYMPPTQTQPIGLLCDINGSGTAIQLASMKVYSFKITKDDTLVRGFIPCYRKADNVIGMYDLVNDVFYTNAGTGNFTKGNDVVVETYKDITKVYLGSTQVRPTQSGGWQPSANTLLYLPLESDVVDQSGQATTRTFTTSGLSYTTVGGVPSVHMGTTGGIKLTAPYPLIPYTVTDPVTFSVLIYVTSAQTSGRRLIADTGATGGNRIWSCIYEGTTNIRFAIDYNAVNYVNLTATNYSVANTWIHVLATVTTTSSKLYIDGNLVDSGGGCPAPGGWWSFAYDNTQGIFCTRDVGSYTSGLNGNARELIIENKEWTAQEVVDYYTRIKAKLGI